MTHAQAQFHFSPNWKYSFHLLCVPPSQELRLSLGWNGRNGAKLSEMKYALSRLSPKWKKKKGKRKDLWQIQQTQNCLKHSQRNFSRTDTQGN